MVTCQLIWSQILVSLWFLRMVSKTSEWNWKYICLRLLKLPHICINLRKLGRKRLIDCRMGKWILFHLLRNFIITLFQKSEFFKKMPNTVETKLDGVQNNVYKRHIVNNCLFICWNIKGSTSELRLWWFWLVLVWAWSKINSKPDLETRLGNVCFGTSLVRQCIEVLASPVSLFCILKAFIPFNHYASWCHKLNRRYKKRTEIGTGAVVTRL